MKKVRIVADSTCDLTKDLLAKYDISIIPLCIVMDGKSYYDGEDVTPTEIFKWADENKTTPKTAAIPFDKTEAVLKPFMAAGVVTDEQFKVAVGGAAVDNLYGCGAILSGYNPVKEGCGAGVAMFTALKVAENILNR